MYSTLIVVLTAINLQPYFYCTPSPRGPQISSHKCICCESDLMHCLFRVKNVSWVAFIYQHMGPSSVKVMAKTVSCTL